MSQESGKFANLFKISKVGLAVDCLWSDLVLGTRCSSRDRGYDYEVLASAKAAGYLWILLSWPLLPLPAPHRFCCALEVLINWRPECSVGV